MAALSLGFQGVATAAPAGATGWPTGCTYGTNSDNGSLAYCSHSNGGHYKATVICARIDGEGKVVRDAGVWKSSGVSNVYCPPETIYSSAGIITKAS